MNGVVIAFFCYAFKGEGCIGKEFLPRLAWDRSRNYCLIILHLSRAGGNPLNRIGFLMQGKTLSANTLRVGPLVRGEDGHRPSIESS